LQDFGEVIFIGTRAMGLERKASKNEKQPPRSGLVQPTDSAEVYDTINLKSL